MTRRKGEAAAAHVERTPINDSSRVRPFIRGLPNVQTLLWAAVQALRAAPPGAGLDPAAWFAPGAWFDCVDEACEIILHERGGGRTSYTNLHNVLAQTVWAEALPDVPFPF